MEEYTLKETQLVFKKFPVYRKWDKKGEKRIRPPEYFIMHPRTGKEIRLSRAQEMEFDSVADFRGGGTKSLEDTSKNKNTILGLKKFWSKP